MNVLVLNSGSSSLKFQLIHVDNEKILEKGVIDGIGLPTCKFIINGVTKQQKIKNHTEAIKIVLSHIPLEKIDAIGHRVVHGGENYSEATVITPAVIRVIDRLSELAPLHNPPNLAGIIACKKMMPKIKQVAIFDTAFHQTIPEKAYLYGIPYEFYKKYKIRKYGFHGTSHKYVMQQAQKMLGKKNVNLITCHLGNGSSITAIKNGKSVDTTMGLTPLQGLMMGTRSGDIDPEIVAFLSNKEKMSAHDVIKLLNKQSGLKGICGYSDVRTIHDKSSQAKCKLALDMFAYRILEYIGAYHAVVGKTDAIVFTAGIGQGAWYLRKTICNALAHIGVVVDAKKNRKHELVITTPRSKVKVLIIPTNEELMIAKETKKVLSKR
jgi:acetate kinase